MSAETRLWDWAVAAYATPGVEPLLLDLQDRAGHSIPYLLWVAWMATSGRVATDDDLRDGAAVARDWDARVVVPLRQVRRALRGAGHEALREQVKVVELTAERGILAMLESRSGPPGAVIDLGHALHAGARAWSQAAPEGELDTLARLLR